MCLALIILFMGAFYYFPLLSTRSLDYQWATGLRQRGFIVSEESQRLLPLLNTYRGLVWALWFKLWLNFVLPVSALFSGLGFPLGSGATSGRLFTLSLPVSRRNAVFSHAAVCGGELTLLSLLASLPIPMIARLQGQWFSLKDAIIFALLAALGALTFSFFALLLSVTFENNLMITLIALIPLVILVLPLRWLYDLHPRWHISRLIAGEDYFTYGQIPWLGLLISLLVSITLLLISVQTLERRDF